MLISAVRSDICDGTTFVRWAGDPVRTERKAPATHTGDNEKNMALPFDETHGARDPRALAILAKTIYRELRSSGYAERDVMTLASELLGMVATEVKGRRDSQS